MPRRSAVLGVVLVVAACTGSPPPLPAAEYFPRLETELARLDQATRDLTDRFAAELETELETAMEDIDPAAAGSAEGVIELVTGLAITKMQAIVDSHIGQVDLFVERVAELVPPQPIARQHEELVSAFRSWASSGEATIEQLGEAPALNELAVALRGSPYADAQGRVDAACRQLVDNAASIGIALTCPGTEMEVLEVGS